LGRIYPLSVHKQTVYLTKTESNDVNGPWMLIVVLGMGLFALSVNAIGGPHSARRR
jgi:hypothetical protein